MTSKKHVLILCTGNSCRSQMGEAIWNDLADERWIAKSAGSKPAGYVHPLAIAALQEIGLSGEGLESKSVDQFRQGQIDLSVTVCENAHSSCPVLPGVKETLHWPFDDPADATGTDEEKMTVFRRVRDEIKATIMSYIK